MAVASVTTASKVSMFFCCPFDAMGATMATYGGQNVGAKKLDRVGEGLRSCTLLGASYAVIAFVVMYFFGDDLAALFVNEAGGRMLADARTFLVINSAFFIPLALVNIVRFLIQGMGFSAFAILAGVFEMAARTLAGLVLVPKLGFIGACFASPLAWVAADLFQIGRAHV